jgi:hypothetical protein
MSAMVWLLMLYSAATVTLLTITEGIPVLCGIVYNVLCFMALACHAKTSLTDPGSVPLAAIPSERQRLLKDSHSMCGQCQTFKPPMSHHCRICNRCISRMDHHCPWMNNCVGANNLKHFLLFLVYTWSCAAYSLGLFGWNYFFCADEDCTFHPIVVHLVRIMTILCVGAFLFTSSMVSTLQAPTLPPPELIALSFSKCGWHYVPSLHLLRRLTHTSPSRLLLNVFLTYI